MRVHESIGKGPDGRPWGAIRISAAEVCAIVARDRYCVFAPPDSTLESVERIVEEEGGYGWTLIGPVKSCFID
jgi:hypothetical protein